MKKLMYLIALIGIVSFANAQTSNMENSHRVSTKGHAEREITPDIIYLSLSLREYYQDGNNKKKVSIESLEKQLFDAAMKNGVSKNDLTIQNIHSYNYDAKKKNNELLQARQYRIKVTNLARLNYLFDEIDSRGMQSTSISEYDHSQKKQIEKELKTEAVKDARINAEILAAADGLSVGKAVLLNDNSSFNWNDIMPRQQMYGISAMAKSADMSESAEGGILDISIRPIKLVSDIDAVFELQ